MTSWLSQGVRLLLKSRSVNVIPFGKNRGLRLRQSDDLNLDMLLGFHEPNTFEVFDLFVKPGMVVADIGGNVGYFTRFLSKKVGPSGVVHSFEPMPQTFEVMKDTIELNKLENVVPVNKAVSNSNENVTMFLSQTHYMASLDASWAGKSNGSTQVPATTLDNYFEQVGKYPDFIKMDIEGGGVYAVEGMRKCIQANEPYLLLESHTAAEDAAIGKALSLANYRVFRVGDTKPVKYIDRDYKDEFGIYGTVLGIPERKINDTKNWSPIQFQRNRLGQR